MDSLSNIEITLIFNFLKINFTWSNNRHGSCPLAKYVKGTSFHKFSTNGAKVTEFRVIFIPGNQFKNSKLILSQLI